MAILDEAGKPKAAAVEFPVLLSMRQLVVAAAELAQLKTMSPVDWKKRVNSVANPSKR
jgi:hypothetical protein